MRIQYLLLENFAMVKSGMGLDRLELDFKGFKNVITLIVGNNGTGKTGGILSNLHPYAGLGHLETRDDSDIIIPEKDGHKIIIFKTKKHKYYIEHFYKYQGAKRSRKISSYVKKDGKELNQTGNVTSFNLIIESEFGIDINFLKLMRLGPNVRNFISLGATERKTFIAKLLAEVETYLKDQRYANERSTMLSNALKIAIDKKKQLNISDTTTLKDTMNGIEKRLEFYRSSKESEIKDFFAYKGSVDADRFANCDEELRELDEEMKSVKDELAHLEKPKFVHIEVQGDGEDIYEKRIEEIRAKREKYVSKLARYNTKIEMLTEELQSIDSSIQESRNTMEVQELESLIDTLNKEIKYYESNFSEDNVPSMTKEELNSDVDKLNMILFHLDQILALPKYTLKYFAENYNHYGLDLNKMDRWAHKRLESVLGDLHQLEKVKSKPLGRVEIMMLPSGCNHANECPYYMEIQSGINAKKVSKEEKASLEEELECADGLVHIANELHSIMRVLSMRSDKIKEYHVSIENVIQCILSENKKYLVDLELIQSLLEHIEFHDKYIQNKKELQNAKKELELLQSKLNIQDMNSLLSKQSAMMITLSEYRDIVRDTDKMLERTQQMMNVAEEYLRDYRIMIEYDRRSDELNRVLTEIQEKKDSYHDILEARSKYKQREIGYNEKINMYDFQISEAEKELQNLRLKESNFRELTAEIKHVEEYYEYAELIKEAVSSRTGIPKIHIMFYCRALKTLANKIIEEIYDGELILRDFIIDDSKFDIPYYTKGVNVSDIRYGSQAETSVATIALSFAILMQFMPKYNIILLDEIDGPMHETNKERLFASLEGQLKAMGCEQVFLITQSKAYNNYPVNLIITDPEYSKTVSNKQQVIFQR